MSSWTRPTRAEPGRRPALAWVVATALSLLAACSLFTPDPGPSAVGRGLKYQTGKQQFDQFFSALHDWQVKLEQAPDRERAIRAQLAADLEVPEGATIGLLSADVERRARKLASSGVRTRLEVEGYDAQDALDVSATLRFSGPELSGPARRAAESVVVASRHELALMAELRSDANQLEKQLALSALLEDAVDETFRTAGPSKTAEVHKNLSDARKVIPLMVSRAREVAEDARRVVRALERAISTDTRTDSVEPPLIVAEDQPAAPAAADPEPEPKKATKRRSTRPAAKTRSAPAAPAPKNAPPAGDFVP
ncbi:MAG: hypothetical protein JW940_09055 [Polyangiaceae bacterium]|nr:hypothetical protein [Polyangiaceae bacterium]